MAGSFSISYSWAPSVRDDEFGSPERPAVYLALLEFLLAHRGQFTIAMGRDQTTFDLYPDLADIFLDLPAVMTALLSGSADWQELDFFTPGTEVLLLFRREASTIKGRFEVDPFDDGMHGHLSDDLHVLESDAVFEAWGRFLMALLDALAAHCPERSADPSFAVYRSLAHRLRTAVVPPG